MTGSQRPQDGHSCAWRPAADQASGARVGARKRNATLASAGHSDDGADEFAVWHNLAGTARDRERILAAAVVEACQLEQRLQRRGAGQHRRGYQADSKA